MGLVLASFLVAIGSIGCDDDHDHDCCAHYETRTHDDCTLYADPYLGDGRVSPICLSPTCTCIHTEKRMETVCTTWRIGEGTGGTCPSPSAQGGGR